MDIHTNSYIGEKGAFWQRVCLVFEGLGYTAPKPDTEGEQGAYVMNIQSQYLADLTPEEVIQIIEYAQYNSVPYLQNAKDQGEIDRETVFEERSW